MSGKPGLRAEFLAAMAEKCAAAILAVTRV
jgi:hypothetical protein